MKIRGIHHMAVAVDDIEKYTKLLESLFDLKAGPMETSSANKVALTFIDIGNSRLELVRPLDNDSSIAKFIADRGPGIHHFCLLVDDIQTAIDELRQKKVRLVDETPRQGAGGSLIAFIHPESTGGILIELKQEKKGQ
jgi:methylmalonyl-CoA/ethylmalonyl-CoA epimerase